MTGLFDDDRAGFECKISAVMTCEGDIVRGVDSVCSDGWMVGDLFRNELRWL